jgi:hypothetical protein
MLLTTFKLVILFVKLVKILSMNQYNRSNLIKNSFIVKRVFLNFSRNVLDSEAKWDFFMIVKKYLFKNLLIIFPNNFVTWQKKKNQNLKNSSSLYKRNSFRCFKWNILYELDCITKSWFLFKMHLFLMNSHASSCIKSFVTKFASKLDWFSLVFLFKFWSKRSDFHFHFDGP